MSVQRHLCIARQDGTLLRMRPKPDSLEVPEEIAATAHIDGLQACSFGPDGTLYAVADGPPRLLRIDGLTPNVQVVDVEQLPSPKPRQLVVDGHGGFHVRYLDDGLLGIGRSASGGLVELPKDGVLRIDGVALGFGMAQIWQAQPVSFGSGAVLKDEYSVVQRPDGVLVMTSWRHRRLSENGASTLPASLPWIAVAPESGAVALVHPWKGDPRALAVVPGGVAVDPWTGAPLKLWPGGVVELAGAASTPASNTGAPAANDASDSGGDGCSATRASGGGLNWILALLGVAGFICSRRRGGIPG